ncbi:MAG: hypothetical protein WDO69_05610 [Pseudomonadota bacterium]
MGDEVSDDETLWRRVGRLNIKPDGTPDSVAFRSAELSVHRKHLTTLDAVRDEYPDFAVFEFTAREARDAGVTLKPDPPPPDHALACVSTSKKAKRLRDIARLVVA